MIRILQIWNTNDHSWGHLGYPSICQNCDAIYSSEWSNLWGNSDFLQLGAMMRKPVGFLSLFINWPVAFFEKSIPLLPRANAYFYYWQLINNPDRALSKSSRKCLMISKNIAIQGKDAWEVKGPWIYLILSTFTNII